VSDLRRGLLAFDLSAVPDDAVVISATVTLFVSRTNAVIQTVGLHRVLADWGEGDSDAPAEEGGGAAATAGDATWEYSFWEAQSWATPGGDFEAAPSASHAHGSEEISRAPTSLQQRSCCT
jgi:hypothetical protein